MAEFMQKHAKENQRDEDDAVQRRRRPLLTPRAEADPRQKDDKRDVNFDGGPAEAA